MKNHLTPGQLGAIGGGPGIRLWFHLKRSPGSENLRSMSVTLDGVLVMRLTRQDHVPRPSVWEGHAVEYEVEAPD
jgi:hypothetical protein